MVVLNLFWRNKKRKSLEKEGPHGFQKHSFFCCLTCKLTAVPLLKVYSLMRLGQFLSTLPSGLRGPTLYFLRPALLCCVCCLHDFSHCCDQISDNKQLRTHHGSRIGRLGTLLYTQEAERDQDIECSVTHFLQQSSTV